MPPATLYVVATPLGHLGDLSPRAAELLRTVPVVAAEDTRRVRGLLAHLDAHPKVLSFHAHSPERRVEALLEILREGRDVALVTDAGTPAISDPGAVLVAAARQAGFHVVPVPGPAAVTAALSAAGFPADRYLFLGFVPRKGKERDRLLRIAAAAEWTVVFYEAANRLGALLDDLAALAGPDRRAVVARELTKVHEEIRAGTLAELAARYGQHAPPGEVTVVLEGAGTAEAPAVNREDMEQRAARLLAGGLSRRDAVQQLVAETSLPRNEAYRIVMSLP
ncbi:MAG TPA: 16S rRNA (cytidine(1402)-2'-O)-methyltransferase [Gemmatimonadales bacterium]|nr:16S rRNA (cytidine(1402)-2'-O)-methyltransferase [Gemmatimonadales bacterium]